MRFVDEFRDPELARSLVTQLEKLMEKLPHFTEENPLYLMEVCAAVIRIRFLNSAWIAYCRKVLSLSMVPAVRYAYYRWGELMYALKLRSNPM